MSTFLYIVLLFAVALIVLATIAPKSYHVSRSIIIQRPVDQVFVSIKYLKNHDHWSPWAKKDPTMKTGFSGTDGEPGCVSSWEGNKEVGAGEHELKRIVDNEIVESELRFLKPFKSTSKAYIKVIPNDAGTEVTWGFTGKNKFPFSIMMLFMNMDKQVGKDFEEGLENLKKLVESK